VGRAEDGAAVTGTAVVGLGIWRFGLGRFGLYGNRDGRGEGGGGGVARRARALATSARRLAGLTAGHVPSADKRALLMDTGSSTGTHTEGLTEANRVREIKRDREIRMLKLANESTKWRKCANR
jgi:hypothetical protein